MLFYFLNKMDLFEERLKTIPFKDNNFKGKENDQQEVIQFIIGQFRMKTKEIDSQQRNLFYHITTAFDSENIKNVWTDVSRSIINKYLQTQNFK